MFRAKYLTASTGLTACNRRDLPGPRRIGDATVLRVRSLFLPLPLPALVPLAPPLAPPLAVPLAPAPPRPVGLPLALPPPPPLDLPLARPHAPPRPLPPLGGAISSDSLAGTVDSSPSAGRFEVSQDCYLELDKNMNDKICLRSSDN
ncbi:hypothetical protein TKK_0010225 [Trichogramma kaykai]